MQPIDESVILVTGSTDGMGKLIAQDLAAMGATILVHGRDTTRCERTLDDIRAATGSDKLRMYLADFSSLDDVRNMAKQVEADLDRLDVLINNAGIGGGPAGAKRETSYDGHELRFAVNYLAPFLLTNLLLPLLQRSAPARIVNVASMGQHAIDFDDVMITHGYDRMRAYRQSKLAQVMFTFSLAEQLHDTGVTVTALHPASLMDTKMVYESFGYTMSTMREGADATERLAIAPELDNVTGRYFDGQQESRANDQAYDQEARRQLWTLSDRLCNIAPAPVE